MVSKYITVKQCSEQVTSIIKQLLNSSFRSHISLVIISTVLVPPPHFHWHDASADIISWVS